MNVSAIRTRIDGCRCGPLFAPRHCPERRPHASRPGRHAAVGARRPVPPAPTPDHRCIGAPSTAAPASPRTPPGPPACPRCDRPAPRRAGRPAALRADLDERHIAAEFAEFDHGGDPAHRARHHLELAVPGETAQRTDSAHTRQRERTADSGREPPREAGRGECGKSPIRGRIQATV
jgi:hypothetical protein